MELYNKEWFFTYSQSFVSPQSESNETSSSKPGGLSPSFIHVFGFSTFTRFLIIKKKWLATEVVEDLDGVNKYDKIEWSNKL